MGDVRCMRTKRALAASAEGAISLALGAWRRDSTTLLVFRFLRAIPPVMVWLSIAAEEAAIHPFPRWRCILRSCDASPFFSCARLAPSSRRVSRARLTPRASMSSGSPHSCSPRMTLPALFFVCFPRVGDVSQMIRLIPVPSGRRPKRMAQRKLFPVPQCYPLILLSAH